MNEWWIPAVIFLVSTVLMVKSASLAVKYILEAAKVLSLTPFIASFVLAAFVSIFPEFFVAVNSALEGVTDIGIGTLIGNNIVDLTLVIGILVIMGKEIPYKGKNRVPTTPFLVAIGLPLLLMLDGVLTFLDGFVLVAAAVTYFGYMIYLRRDIRETKRPVDMKKMTPPLALFGLTMVAIYFSSRFLVESVVELSMIVGIPEIFAGLFLISIGSALPELTFSVQAVLARHKAVGLADILGNVALDATFSIGVMAMITPVPIDLGIIGVSTLIMGLAALLLTTYLDNDSKLTRRDGIAMIGLFVVFVVVQLATNGDILAGASVLPHP